MALLSRVGLFHFRTRPSRRVFRLEQNMPQKMQLKVLLSDAEKVVTISDGGLFLDVSSIQMFDANEAPVVDSGAVVTVGVSADGLSYQSKVASSNASLGGFEFKHIKVSVSGRTTASIVVVDVKVCSISEAMTSDSYKSRLACLFTTTPYTASTLPDPDTLEPGMTVLVDGAPSTVLSDGLSTQRKDIKDPIKTACGTYTGTGAALSVSLGFKPDIVLVKPDSANECFWKSVRGVWFDRTDNYGTSPTVGGGVTLTDDGFSVGTSAVLNAAGVTCHYIAILGVDAGALACASWQGNGTDRVIDSFVGKKPRVALIKRDSALPLVYAVRDIGRGVTLSGDARVAELDADGYLTLDGAAATNQWAGAAGEGTTSVAFCDHPDIFFTTYTGAASVQSLPCPFDVEGVLIFPLETGASGTTVMWWSSLAQGEHLSVGNVAKGTGRITSVVDGSVTLPVNTYTNATGVDYGLLAIRKRRQTSYAPRTKSTISKFVKLSSGGYINCGNSDTLKFDGPCTLEWCGAIYPAASDAAPYASGLGTGINNVAKKQIPLIFRSLGADAVDGSVSFGLAAVAPRPDGTGQPGGDWNGFNLTWAVCNAWELPSSTSPELDNFPAFSGIKLDIGRVYHVALTHNGAGLWKLYLDGVLVKERNRDMLAATGKRNIAGGAGHYTSIGARRRGAGTFDHATGSQLFCFARVYNRPLSADEVSVNYQASQYGYNAISTGLLEEWDSRQASGSTINARVNSANNGAIVSGVIVG